jgi:enamine deaminase RidA (YjgF/YER057c/UK114 family)
MLIEQRLTKLGIKLLPTTPPIGSFERTVQAGNLLFVSGHASLTPGQTTQGKVGYDVTLDEAYNAARLIAIDMLGTLRETLGDLDRVKRLVKLLGMVQSAEDFTQQPQVINGASNLLIEVFGDKGRHARSAIGVTQLPNNASVEIEMIVELENTI